MQSRSWNQKRQESYNILDNYKDELNETQYTRIKQVIGSSAIEDLFASEESISNMVTIEKGEATADDIINGYKEAWGVA